MKSSLTIDVKEPCKENFANFNKTDKGGFCASCQKEVIDFTNFSDQELVRYLNSTSKKTCGKFKSSQLKSYETNTHYTMNNSILTKGIGMMGLSLLALCTTEVKAQETANIEPPIEVVSNQQENVMGMMVKYQEKYTLGGTILDEANEPLPGVNVILKGTTVGIQTDFDGKFEFPQQLKENDILVFSFIGYETKTYKVLPSVSSTIDINITFDTYDVELMGDIVIGGTYKSKRNIFQKIGDIFK
ncbi:carboxypeptidase-like regulatory domain-containing protein [Maribacter stanieri]|uniref:carboxypeptidase-like regulatory domain-containing protein n=1 Tax=Maribacter stanieri TaxID=440514 RepID=UPI002494272B|nr:carboxypeptidase-like regulatory domain-containing protein [Maribacter stanieri]|tara:strand:+ start:859 stop:1590 length:732 start_codon:yes stop_codon:yes gene_type:complete